MTKKKVLVTGCGRSGTNYMSILLRRCRLDVRHEKRMGADGISSWLFGADSSTVPWGPTPAEYRFDHTFHLVRHPLSAIPSIATFSRSAWHYVSSHVRFEASDSLILRSAKYWLHWNEIVERRAGTRLKIEEMPGAVATVCAEVEAPVDISSIREVPNDLNTRRYGMLLNLLESKCLEMGLARRNMLLRRLLALRPPRYENVTWEELRAQDPSLTERIHSKALEYGYEDPAARAAKRD